MISKAEAKEIARMASEEAIKNAFDMVGIDLSSSTARKNFRKTWEFSEKQRMTSEEASAAIKKSLWYVVLPAAMLAALTFFWTIFSNGLADFLAEFINKGTPS